MLKVCKVRILRSKHNVGFYSRQLSTNKNSNTRILCLVRQRIVQVSNQSKSIMFSILYLGIKERIQRCWSLRWQRRELSRREHRSWHTNMIMRRIKYGARRKEDRLKVPTLLAIEMETTNNLPSIDRCRRIRCNRSANIKMYVALCSIMLKN